MLKRTTFALMLAAALTAAAPSAPLATDLASGELAWGHFLSTARSIGFGDAGMAVFGISSTVVCTLVPVGLALGGAGGVVFGLACGIAGVG